MKTIGILGGMSWQSSMVYYRLLNQGIQDKCGGLHSAAAILYSMDFEPLQRLQHDGNWSEIAARLADAARCAETAGADFLLLATNTMHKVAADIQAAINIPLLHISDAAGEECNRRGFSKLGLLATAFTMEEDFYKTRLQQQYGIEVIIPPPLPRQHVHRIIYQELCRGDIQPGSKRQYLQIIDGLAASGAEAVLLGCTEINLLLSQPDTDIPLLDSTALHVRQALQRALE